MNLSKSLRGTVALGAIAVLGGAWAVVRAQAPAKKDASQKSAGDVPAYSPSNSVVTPRTGWGGYPFSPYTDAEIADPDVHRVLYADDRIMLLEVTNPPGLDVHMHGHPYPSVFAQDVGGNSRATDPALAALPADPKIDSTTPFNDQGSGEAPPPQGMKYPTCSTSQPQAPHKPLNNRTTPGHFYRIEFKRLDGDDIQTHWKEWYPEMTKPVKPVADLVRGPALGPNFSEEWPYPIGYDSVQAAPNNYQLLYEDGKIRLLEVMIRPGETTPMHGDPYPSVVSFNSPSGDPSTVTDTKLDPESPLNGQSAGHAPPPSVNNMKFPICMTTAPQAPHKIHNAGTAPLHYYRFEYKRIDGDDFKNNWQKWYPWMMYMKYMR
jgi:hypothetical protein